jgi:hypothetical protein
MLLLCTVVANAQQIADTSNWKHTAMASVTAAQVSYKDWAQGGENVLAWTAMLEGKSLYDLPIEGGLESVMEVDARLYDNLFFKAKLELFSPIRKMQEIVVRSDNTLVAKINKYFSTNINVQLIQERPVTSRTQVKQSVALGFNYVLF